MFYDWEFLLERVKRTEKVFGGLVRKCKTTVNFMWMIEDEIAKLAKAQVRAFTPQESFVLAYFRRNTIYLQASLLLNEMNFSHASKNLLRTVYETILQGYLFIVNISEATDYYAVLGSTQERQFLKKREFYRHDYLCRSLFKKRRIESQKKFYHELCISAHAEIKGVLLDFPKYEQREIPDRLKLLLSLSYGNIQMVAEMFYGLLEKKQKVLIKKMLREIVITLGKKVPLFEPDRNGYACKIKLQKGNFMTVL